MMMRRLGSLCEFCSLPFLLDDNGWGRGGAHTSRGKTDKADKHYTVRGFGTDGHARFTFHVPSESEDGAVPFPNGGEWELQKSLDIKHCVDLRESLVKRGLDRRTERKRPVVPAKWLAQLRQWIQ